MWATDCSYLRVVSWGYYYLITVMDDYSRYILGWELKRDMTADSRRPLSDLFACISFTLVLSWRKREICERPNGNFMLEVDSGRAN